MDTVKAYHTHYVIPNYTLGDNHFVENQLSLWDDVYFKSIPVGYYYKEETHELLLPRGIDINFIEKQFKRPIDVLYGADPYEVASFRLLCEPRSNIQRKAIAYLLGEDDFKYAKSYSQQALTLDTGDGKTYSVIAAISFLKMRSMIILPSQLTTKLKEQWTNSILQFTDMPKEFICDISGSSQIDKLMTAKNIKYKIFIVGHSTLHSYASKHGWESIRELFQKLKIGIKVYDEAHMNFNNLIMVDLFTNTKKTFYLTANFERSERNENKMFDFVFQCIPKFGRSTRNEKRKHIVYIPILLDSNPSLDDEIRIKGVKGFDKNKYSDYFLSKDISFDVILYTMNFLRNEDGKVLILSSKIDSVEEIYRFFKDNFPDKKVGMYHSKLSDEDKININDCDIISATPKSSGTGFDLPKLRIVIMLEPYSSLITANQTSGRLREYAPDKYTFYIELVDKGFKKIYSMYKKRKKVFKEKCAKIIELEYKK